MDATVCVDWWGRNIPSNTQECHIQRKQQPNTTGYQELLSFIAPYTAAVNEIWQEKMHHLPLMKQPQIFAVVDGNCTEMVIFVTFGKYLWCIFMETYFKLHVSSSGDYICRWAGKVVG